MKKNIQAILLLCFVLVVALFIHEDSPWAYVLFLGFMGFVNVLHVIRHYDGMNWKTNSHSWSCKTSFKAGGVPLCFDFTVSSLNAEELKGLIYQTMVRLELLLKEFLANFNRLNKHLERHAEDLMTEYFGDRPERSRSNSAHLHTSSRSSSSRGSGRQWAPTRAPPGLRRYNADEEEHEQRVIESTFL